MANKTFLDLRTEVAAIGPFDTAAQVTRTGLWVNDASDWVIGSRLWAWRETTTTVASVSGQATYVLTGTSPVVTDFAGVLIDVTHSIANATPNNAPKLRFWQQQDFDAVLSITGATPGPAVFYTLRGGSPKTTSATILPGGEQQLAVWPVPNYIGQFALRYFRSVDSCRMSGDSDVSLIPQQLLPAVVARAAGWGLITKGQVLQGQELMQTAQQLLNDAIAVDEQARASDLPAGDRPVFPQQVSPNPASTAPRTIPYGYGQG